MKLLTLITTVVLAVLSTSPAHAKERAQPADDPKLPRVLLIGDSISIGYTPEVQKLLSGKANVHRIPANGGPTKKGLENLKAWLGDGKWDVIHFNWGLHDLNKQLKATNANLIWAATTPVPDATVTPPRLNSDVIAYNAIAKTIMDGNGVAIHDLYEFALPQLKNIQLQNDVHYSPEGSAVLARQVVASIESVLPKPATP